MSTLPEPSALRPRSAIAAVMLLFSALGSLMGFSVETLGFYALFLPLMAALGYDRLVTASMIIPSSARHPLSCAAVSVAGSSGTSGSGEAGRSAPGAGA